MRINLTSILIFFLVTNSVGQFSPPKEFRLVSGENLTGVDDIYTNGKYSFDTHKIFRDHDFTKFNDSVKTYLSNFFGFPFYVTRDSLCWGTGKHKELFSYVVVGTDGELVELYSDKNDSGFDYYSKWLLSTARQYKKTGRSLIFPMRQK